MVLFTVKLPTLLVAKNGRASEYIRANMDLGELASEPVGAEDIPWLVAEELPQYLGLTTTEYLLEYKLRKAGKPTSLVFNRIVWEDEACIFGKPFIAAIGQKGMEPDIKAAKKISLAVRKGTKQLSTNLAIEYIKTNYSVFEVALKLFSREVEMAVAKGIADLAIEVVSTGKTVREKYEGLEIYAPLFGIDLALVANKNYLSQLRGG